MLITLSSHVDAGHDRSWVLRRSPGQPDAPDRMPAGHHLGDLPEWVEVVAHSR